jgi:hypothetical protein
MEEYHLIRVTEDYKIKDSFQAVYLFELALVSNTSNSFYNKTYSLTNGDLFLIGKGTDLGEMIYSKINKEEFIIIDLKEFEKRFHKIDGNPRTLHIHKSITKQIEEVHEYVNQEINGNTLTHYKINYALKRLNNKCAFGIKLNNLDKFSYKTKNYYLDGGAEPIRIEIGNEILILFFLKEIENETIENKEIWAQFIISGFKENDNLFGAPINDYHSPMIVNRAFEEIGEKFKEIENHIQDHIFEEKEIGSFEIKVNFLTNPESDPETILKANGFSFEEINQLVKYIYDLIPSNKK